MHIIWNIMHINHMHDNIYILYPSYIYIYLNVYNAWMDMKHVPGPWPSCTRHFFWRVHVHLENILSQVKSNSSSWRKMKIYIYLYSIPAWNIKVDIWNYGTKINMLYILFIMAQLQPWPMQSLNIPSASSSLKRATSASWPKLRNGCFP